MIDIATQQERWARDPRQASRDWLGAAGGPGYAEHSIAQYAAMIGTAADWLDAHAGQTVWQAQARDIDRFLKGLAGRGGRPASASTVKRYVATLNMLFSHLQLTGLRASNPMDELRHAAVRQGAVRQAPRFLTTAQCDLYQAWVLSQASAHWCDKRDAALRAIYLATGITVEESLALSWRDLRLKDSPPHLRVRARTAVQDRRIPLPAWSLPVLSDWVACRMALPVLGDAMFLARKRSPTVEVDGGEALASVISTSEIYDIVRPAMEAAGLDDEQLGPQTLRNSYAVRQLSQDVETALLQKWMGLRTAFSIDAIRRGLAGDGGVAPI
jgi:integrase/recombinase XerD